MTRLIGAYARSSSVSGKGVVVYLRGPDGQGISRVHDLVAVEAGGERHGLECEVGDDLGFAIGAQILRDLGIRRMRLLGEGSRDFPEMSEFGLEIVERIPLDVVQGRSSGA